MRLRSLTYWTLLLVPLLVCAGRIHAHRAGTPDGVTREVNRALLAVRIAAARRRSNATRLVTERERHATAGVQAAHAGVQVDAAALPVRRDNPAELSSFPRTA